MNRPISDRAGNAALLILVLLVNTLASIGVINGQTTAAVSDRYPSPFTPAGFTFSIWSVIYLALIAFVVYQALPPQSSSAVLGKIGGWFKLSCAANVVWMLVWQYDFVVLSNAVMAVLLLSLLVIYWQLHQLRAWLSVPQSLFLRLPFSLYLGWIVVATVANLSVAQTALGLDDSGLDAVSWTLLKLAIVGAVAAVFALRLRDTAFALVVAWAAFGISRGQAATPPVAGAATMLVVVALILAAIAAFERVLTRPR